MHAEANSHIYTMYNVRSTTVYFLFILCMRIAHTQFEIMASLNSVVKRVLHFCFVCFFFSLHFWINAGAGAAVSSQAEVNYGKNAKTTVPLHFEPVATE